jgi:iron complex outermembrane recepter protein
VEIPQTINVISAAEIKARGAQSVTQALLYTPGMSAGGFSDRVKLFDEPTSRGFSPTPLYLDGLHLPYGGGSTGGALQIEPYSLERIEVLKGPASVLYGHNQPGGIVNMVSKRPSETPVRQVVLEAGTYEHKARPSTSVVRWMIKGSFSIALPGASRTSKARSTTSKTAANSLRQA